MKNRTFTLVILILTTSTIFAQSHETDFEIYQEAFGLDKKVAIANSMILNDSEETFWNIYDEYEIERKSLGKKRAKLTILYAKSYPDITDEEIIDFSKKIAKVRKSSINLQKTYFKKISKEIDVRTAAQFTQIESYFNAMILADIYSKIPFIGEFAQDNPAGNL